MSRIGALVILLAVIVASGFWLARDRGNATTPPATNPQVAGSTTAPGATTPSDSSEGAPESDDPLPSEPTPTDPESPTANGTDASPDAAETTGPSEDTPGGLPELTLTDGFEVVPYLTDAPVQAFDAPQEVLDTDLDYIAVLRTNRGDITVDLYEERAPITVNNFVFLALNHYYDGVPFHRVLEGFMAQTGDPTGTGRGGPGYQFDDEIDPDLHFDAKGILAMANAGKTPSGEGTNGSQFFITFEPTPWLDGNHTIFGHVIAGAELLDAITRVDPGTPSVVAAYDEPALELADRGIDLDAPEGATVEEAVEALMGSVPVAGQSFNLAGYVVAAGQAGGKPAFGFFPIPDRLDTVVIATRARE